MIECRSLVVRLCETEHDAELLSQALRHASRWQRVGLTTPPTQHLLARRVQVRLPAGERLVRARAAWAFERGHLIALLFDYGWNADIDRVRVMHSVWLDDRARARQWRSTLREGFLALAFDTLRAQTIRTPASAEGLLAGREGTRGIELASVTWLSLPRKRFAADSSWRACQACPKISAADRRHFGAFGPGHWPAPAMPTGRSGAAIEVRNPGVAHRFMLQSGALQRPLFFPEHGPIEDVDVLVVGAGLAGLAAAYALRPRRTLVLELEDRIAGTAAAGESDLGRFPLAAHYEHELCTNFDAEIIRIHQDLGIVRRQAKDGRYPFVDEHYLVDRSRHEQYLDARGRLFGDVWNLMHTPETITTARRIADYMGQMPLPGRLAAADVRELQNITFNQWAAQQGLEMDPPLAAALDTGFRSDYGGNAGDISAFAGIHYLTCRPYLSAEPRTLSPPEGLCYFADRLVESTPEAEIRTKHMVRRMWDRRDHVEVLALDLREHKSRRLRAKYVVFAAPKKLIKWVFPADAGLFCRNVYAAWIVVTTMLSRLPEKDMLFWSNGIFHPEHHYVGVTWANHHRPDDPPILGHYIVFPPGRWHHVPVLIDRPRRILRLCMRQLRALIGRDATCDVDRVVIQKLGHAMPTPVPGTLFTNPNARRSCQRIVYAGVDTGRLPLLIEALDSGLEAARSIDQSKRISQTPRTAPA